MVTSKSNRDAQALVFPNTTCVSYPIVRTHTIFDLKNSQMNPGFCPQGLEAAARTIRQVCSAHLSPVVPASLPGCHKATVSGFLVAGPIPDHPYLGEAARQLKRREGQARP